ncbi:hypothetical protein LZ32DRAFT_675824, partial [Colletotrichum eremochloae]
EYCCPWDTGLYECKWRGSAPDCVGANCKTVEDGKDLFEVQVDAHAGGSSWNLCSYDRKKALCCQVRVELPEPLTCEIDSCDIDVELCSQTGEDDWGNYFERRGVAGVDQDEHGLAMVSRDYDLLERRDGGKRRYPWVTSFGLVILQYSLTYPSPQGYMTRLRQGLIDLARAWVVRSQNCGRPGVEGQTISPSTGAPDRTQVEHTIPLVIASRFASVAEHGRMWAARPAGYMRGTREIGQAHPEGPVTNTPAVGNEEFWRNVWNNAEGLPSGLPRVSERSPEDQRRPVDRIFEALGSSNNPAHFTLLQDNINGMKGRVEIFNAPMAQDRFDTFLEDATDSENDSRLVDVMSFMAPLRELVGLFQYLRADDVVTRIDATAAAVLFQLQLIELHVPESQGLSAHWNEFYPEYFGMVSEFSRTWARDRIRQIREHYDEHTDADHREEILDALKEIENDIPDWKYPSED